MENSFKQDNPLFISYLKSLIDKVFKILPIYENEKENKILFKYIQSLLYELNGLTYCVEDIKDDGIFLTIFATLESLSDDAILLENNKETVKREVFKCLTLINRLISIVSGDNK